MQRRKRLMAMAMSLSAMATVGLGQPGCSHYGGGLSPHLSQFFAPRPAVPNPLVVPIDDFELVWNKTIAVVDKYFDIASENRLSRTIITQPKNGATLLEPWSGDSVGIRERMESTAQTIRRFAQVKIDPAPAGGFLVKVEVNKELEDLVKPDRQAAGRAVFNSDFPINRTREIIGPVPAPVGWINRGRDPNLEQAILAGIRDALFL